MMTSRFDVDWTRDTRRGHLYVKLMGNLDENSARRVIELLKENGRGVHVVVIETDELESIELCGVEAFEQGLVGLKDLCYRLIFYGRYAGDLAPAWVDYI